MELALETRVRYCDMQKSAVEALVISDPELKRLDRYGRRALRRRLEAARELNVNTR
jgi:hypothetical protein